MGNCGSSQHSNGDDMLEYTNYLENVVMYPKEIATVTHLFNEGISNNTMKKLSSDALGEIIRKVYPQGFLKEHIPEPYQDKIVQYLIKHIKHISIEHLLDYCVKENTRIKVKGSGHSCNNIISVGYQRTNHKTGKPIPNGILVDMEYLCRLGSEEYPYEGQLMSYEMTNHAQDYWLDGSTAEQKENSDLTYRLLEVQAGIKIKDLNEELEDRGFALENMGGWDGQTFGGVICTSTAGSGYKLGALHTMVQSLVLVTAMPNEFIDDDVIVIGGEYRRNSNVKVYRIERTKSTITDPQKYSNKHVGLIQNDNVFRAVIVSLGCLGVVYSLVIKVVPKYYLAETRTLTTWSKMKKKLKPNPNNDHHDPDVFKEHRHNEIYVSSHLNKQGEYSVIETLRDKVDHPDEREPCERGSRHYLTKAGELPFVTDGIATFMNLCPQKIPKIVNSVLTGLPTVNPPYIDKSYNVFNLGTHEDAGFALEVFVRIYDKDGIYNYKVITDIVDTIHNIQSRLLLQKNHKDDGTKDYLTSPFSLRFVDADDAYLSCTRGTKTMKIEFTGVAGTKYGYETVEKIEQALQSFDIATHFGLDYDVSMHKIANYPEGSTWMKYYKIFNSYKIFSNDFTDRLGLD